MVVATLMKTRVYLGQGPCRFKLGKWLLASQRFQWILVHLVAPANRPPVVGSSLADLSLKPTQGACAPALLFLPYLAPQGRTLPKTTIRLSHHMRLHPIPPLSPDDFTIPFHQQKSPQITSKSVILPPTTTFSGRLVKTPLFSRFTYAGTASQKHP